MTVYLTNFGRTLDATFSTIEEAKQAGIDTGFSFSVLAESGRVVGVYDTLGGWHPIA